MLVTVHFSLYLLLSPESCSNTKSSTSISLKLLLQKPRLLVLRRNSTICRLLWNPWLWLLWNSAHLLDQQIRCAWRRSRCGNHIWYWHHHLLVHNFLSWKNLLILRLRNNYICCTRWWSWCLNNRWHWNFHVDHPWGHYLLRNMHLRTFHNLRLGYWHWTQHSLKRRFHHKSRHHLWGLSTHQLWGWSYYHLLTWSSYLMWRSLIIHSRSSFKIWLTSHWRLLRWSLSSHLRRVSLLHSWRKLVATRFWAATTHKFLTCPTVPLGAQSVSGARWYTIV